MDFVITLDADTASEHPRWNGQPETALWGYASTAATKKGEGHLGVAAIQTLVSLRRRIELLVSLHSRVEDRSELRQDLRDLAHY